MLPVSGAAQLNATGARRGLRPVSSATGAYCRLVSTPGRNRFHRPCSLAAACRSRTTGRVPHSVGGRGQLRLQHRLGRVDVLVEEPLRARDDVDASTASGAKSISAPPASCARPSSASGATRAPIRSKPSPTVSPAEEPEVDALEDDRELVRGERPVPAELRDAAAQAGAVGVDQLVELRVAGGRVDRAGRDAAAALDLAGCASTGRACRGRRPSRRASPSPSRGSR